MTVNCILYRTVFIGVALDLPDGRNICGYNFYGQCRASSFILD